VYLPSDIAVTTAQEDTPVSIRIQVSSATVKALHNRLQQAYLKDDVRLVRRTTVLLDLLVHLVPMALLCERWGLSASCLYAWQRAFLLDGLDSLVYRHGGGRRPKLTPKQKKRLVELLEAGPLVVGLETACWTSGLIRVLIWREFGVLYDRHYVCTLLSNLGFSDSSGLSGSAPLLPQPLDVSTHCAHHVSSIPTATRREMRHGPHRQTDPREPHHYRRFPR
jgi:homeodomain-containing protein